LLTSLLLTKTAQERVASFLLDLANRLAAAEEIKVPMSRQDIADYLGLTIETISRTFTHFETQVAIALPTSRPVQPSRFEPPQRRTRPTRQGLTPQIGSAG
jgi:CRP-like cAMP-binding protein